MNSTLKDFFNEERKRVFAPDPYFSRRVMARVRETTRTRESGIWEAVPGASQPVFGLALVLMLAFLAVQYFMPQMPERGFVSATLEMEQAQTDAPFLYSGTEIPADRELLNQLMGFEDQQ